MLMIILSSPEPNFLYRMSVIYYIDLRSRKSPGASFASQFNPSEKLGPGDEATAAQSSFITVKFKTVGAFQNLKSTHRFFNAASFSCIASQPHNYNKLWDLWALDKHFAYCTRAHLSNLIHCWKSSKTNNFHPISAKPASQFSVVIRISIEAKVLS